MNVRRRRVRGVLRSSRCRILPRTNGFSREKLFRTQRVRRSQVRQVTNTRQIKPPWEMPDLPIQSLLSDCTLIVVHELLQGVSNRDAVGLGRCGVTMQDGPALALVC